MDWILKAKAREESWLMRLLVLSREMELHFGHLGISGSRLHEACKRRCQASVEICESAAQRRGGLGVETSES